MRTVPNQRSGSSGRRFDRPRHDSTKIVEMVRSAGDRGAYADSSPRPAIPASRIARAQRDALLAARFDSPDGAGSSRATLLSSRSTALSRHGSRRDPLRRAFAMPASPATPAPLIDHNAGKVSTQLSLLAETV